VRNLAVLVPRRYIAAFPNPPESPNAVITFLLVVHALIALALVGVILLQKSEGGGLGIGGGTGGGLMTARGAANLLTRSTTVLAALFIGSSILLAVLAAGTNKAKPVDTSLAQTAAPKPPPPVPGMPVLPGTTPATAPAPAQPAGVPIAQ
jgi:preprotein translocase subunit SecG